MSWEERMAQRALERRVAAGEPRIGESPPDFQAMWDALPEWQKSPTPPDDGECRECYEWRAYPEGQRHFGYVWWRTCKSDECDHEHHESEVWLASAS